MTNFGLKEQSPNLQGQRPINKSIENETLKMYSVGCDLFI